MLDIKLCEDGDFDGDLDLTTDGDIKFESNPLQDACISVLWIGGEWRFSPDSGLPWFDEILLKNPNTETIAQYIRDALLQIEGVENADVELVEYNPQKRTVKFRFTIYTEEGTYSKEVSVGE